MKTASVPVAVQSPVAPEGHDLPGHDGHAHGHAAAGTGLPAPEGTWYGRALWFAAIAATSLALLRLCSQQAQPVDMPLPPMQPASGVETPAASASASSDAAVEFGQWSATVAGGTLTLDGRVSSEAARNALLTAARARFGADHVIDHLQVDGSLPATVLGERMDELFGWLQSHAGAGLRAQGHRMALSGTLGEALIDDIASRLHLWFGESVTVDTSGVRIEAMQAAEALRQGATTFRIHVEFDTGKASIRPASHAELDALAEALKSARVKGEIAGYTDHVGNSATNLRLSQARAEAVRAYLVGHGVDAAALTAKGHGDTSPVADNSTPEGRQRNRRVAFIAQ